MAAEVVGKALEGRREREEGTRVEEAIWRQQVQQPVVLRRQMSLARRLEWTSDCVCCVLALASVHVGLLCLSSSSFRVTLAKRSRRGGGRKDVWLLDLSNSQAVCVGVCLCVVCESKKSVYWSGGAGLGSLDLLDSW